MDLLVEENGNTSNQDQKESVSKKLKRRMSRKPGIFYVQLVFKFIHAVIVAAVFVAGVKEFIANPPIFDAYGDATTTDNRLPDEIFENDPRITQEGNLRLLDLPILTIVMIYVGVCISLKFGDLSYLLTLLLCVAVLVFWLVNYWATEMFAWKYYSSRMSGLVIQVMAIALVGTGVFNVMFYKRRKFPFKFRSSLPVQAMGSVHIIFNIVVIYIILFTTMLLWFTKMYISWACFKSHHEILQICQITTQVQCYSCHKCSFDAISLCYKNQTRASMFTCNTDIRQSVNTGAFCIFNYNMSAVEFLTVFAYIGGLCVFLSTFLRIAGHYAMRGLFLVYRVLLRMCNRHSNMLQQHDNKLRAINAIIEQRRLSTASLRDIVSDREQLCDNNNILSPSPVDVQMYLEEQEDDFLGASCG